VGEPPAFPPFRINPENVATYLEGRAERFPYLVAGTEESFAFFRAELEELALLLVGEEEVERTFLLTLMKLGRRLIKLFDQLGG
jgi:hypothetical protein